MRWFFKNRSQNILAIDQILLHSGRVEWGDGGGPQPHYSHEKSKSMLPFRLCFCVLESELCICACVYMHVCVWWLPGGRVVVVGKCSVLLLLLLLSHFSRVRLSATPSLGFSRQEHWSGLPFPSPMHKSEKWKRSRSVMSDSSRPRGLQPTGSSVHGMFQARVLEWGVIAFSVSLALGKSFIWLPSLEFLDCHINIQLDMWGIKKTQRTHCCMTHLWSQVS